MSKLVLLASICLISINTALAVSTSASVANINPTIVGQEARSLLQYDAGDLFICKNMNETIATLYVNASDSNGYEQITSFGSTLLKVSTLVDGIELPLFNPEYQEMQFYYGEGRIASYRYLLYFSNMTQYRMRSRVTDGVIEFNSVVPYDFTLSERDCLGYIEYMTVSNIIIIDASELNTTVFLMPKSSANGSLAVIHTTYEPYEVKNPGAVALGYYEIRADSDIDDSLDKAEVQIRYSDNDVKKNDIDEESIHLYRWGGKGWAKVNGGPDTQSNYVYAIVSDFGIYGVFANKIKRPLKCEPEWRCTEWSDCQGISFQSRDCHDSNHCRATPPIESKRCIYPPSPRIYDLEPTPEPEIKDEKKAVVKKKKPGQRKVLFDIYGELLSDASKGKDMLVKVGLLNFGEPGLVDAAVRYAIKDSADRVLFQENEIVPVETQIEYLKEFDISRLPAGRYFLVLDLQYEGQVEPAQAIIEFNRDYRRPYVLYLAILVSLTTIIILIYWVRRRHTETY